MKGFLFLGFLVISSMMLSAEGPHGTTEKARKKAESKISDAELKFIEKWFDKTTVSITDRFQDPNDENGAPERYLYYGISDATKEPADDTIIANVIAELFGTRNPAQIKAMLDPNGEMMKRIAEEKGKENRDPRFVAFTERIVWAGRYLKGEKTQLIAESTNNDGAVKAFLAKFEPAQKSIHDFNLKTEKYLEEAITGNEATKKAAKEWLRNKVDLKSLGLYLEGQEKTGGKSAEGLMDKYVDAISDLSDDGRHKFADFSHGEGTTRLIFGTDTKSPGAAYRALRAENKDANRFAFHPGRLAKSPEAGNTFNYSGGKLAKGAPEGFKVADSTPVPTSTGQAPTGNNLTVQTQDGGQSAAVQGSGDKVANFNAFKKLVETSGCASCHSGSKELVPSGSSTEDGGIGMRGKRPIKLRDFIARMNRAPTNDQMIQFTANNAVLLRKWASENTK